MNTLNRKLRERQLREQLILDTAKNILSQEDGKYHKKMNQQECFFIHRSNVFETFKPSIPDQYKKSEYVFLANIDPDLQLQVLAQIEKPKLVVLDTMNFWPHDEIPEAEENRHGHNPRQQVSQQMRLDNALVFDVVLPKQAGQFSIHACRHHVLTAARPCRFQVAANVLLVDFHRYYLSRL